MGEHGKHRPLVTVTPVLRNLSLSVLLLNVPIAASAAGCRLALVLAMDVSSSVDAEEDRLQRGGLASALLSEPVRKAFFSTDLPVALAVYEWSGRYNQQVILDWRMIDSQSALREVSDTIAYSKRSYNDFPTAMGYGLGFGAEFPFDDVTVNGLVVNAAEFEAEVELVTYYQNQVLHGPGAFLIIANGFSDYERAMRIKLQRELTPPAIGALRKLETAG